MLRHDPPDGSRATDHIVGSPTVHVERDGVGERRNPALRKHLAQEVLRADLPAARRSRSDDHLRPRIHRLDSARRYPYELGILIRVGPSIGPEPCGVRLVVNLPGTHRDRVNLRMFLPEVTTWSVPGNHRTDVRGVLGIKLRSRRRLPVWSFSRGVERRCPVRCPVDVCDDADAVARRLEHLGVGFAPVVLCPPMRLDVDPPDRKPDHARPLGGHPLHRPRQGLEWSAEVHPPHDPLCLGRRR